MMKIGLFLKEIFLLVFIWKYFCVLKFGRLYFFMKIGDVIIYLIDCC